uniref:Uncharacterized protein n=1 Tax=Clandestinovirus TaxID=2831644 RepID=A0A8F8KRA4_9VIRU|nr:hypothetical protein KOM_12_456 [Clandestinovirus]
MATDLIKERYWRGWIEQYCSMLSSCQKVRLQLQSRIITTPAINIPFTKRQKIVIYWTEWDRIQQQCQERLTSELPHQTLCHFKLIKKHVNRLLESPIDSCIVVSSDKNMLHQMSAHKTGYHLINRPSRIDQLATTGYVARLVADIKEYIALESKIQGVVQGHPDDTSLQVINYDLGYYDEKQKQDLVECILNLTKFHKSHITGLTLQSAMSAHLPIE